MKIASIQQICKGAKRIELFSAPSSSVQWISDGGAFYPLWFVSGYEICEGKVIKISLEVGNITAQPNVSELYYYMKFDNGAVIPAVGKVVFSCARMGGKQIFVGEGRTSPKWCPLRAESVKKLAEEVSRV